MGFGNIRIGLDGVLKILFLNLLGLSFGSGFGAEVEGYAKRTVTDASVFVTVDFHIFFISVVSDSLLTFGGFSPHCGGGVSGGGQRHRLVAAARQCLRTGAPWGSRGGCRRLSERLTGDKQWVVGGGGGRQNGKWIARPDLLGVFPSCPMLLSVFVPL